MPYTYYQLHITCHAIGLYDVTKYQTEEAARDYLASLENTHEGTEFSLSKIEMTLLDL